MNAKTYRLGLFCAFLMSISSSICFAQSHWFVSVGSSFTDYKFKNSAGNLVDYTKPGIGSSFDLGYAAQLSDFSDSSKKASKILQNVFIDAKAQLFQLNAVGSLSGIAALKYETMYAGLSVGIGYRFFNLNGWQLFGKGNISVIKMLQGSQLIASSQGSEYVELQHNALFPEFNNMQLMYGWELQVKKHVNQHLGFYLGYGNRGTSNSAVTKMDGTKATLNFQNNMLQAGIIISPTKK